MSTQDKILHNDWNNLTESMVVINDWANRTLPNRVPEASLSKLVMEEIPELLMRRKEVGSEDIGEELADCFILLMDLAKIWHVDLPESLRKKMLINAQRTWNLDPFTGFYHHVEGDTTNEA